MNTHSDTFTVEPGSVSVSAFHGYLLGAVAPRPIAFVSSIDGHGRVNLSPFSFFNGFGSNPSTLVFSPSRRVRGNTLKHTLENVYETGEVVINTVNYAMVQQMSLASTEYERGVNEFVKAGFTEIPSVRVKPHRVGESPASFECRVKQVIETGQEGGSGNLVICEVVLAHFRKEILDENNKIDTCRVDLVARMGEDWYCRAHGEALFRVEKPNAHVGVGVDAIPQRIRYSDVLTGNDLGKLGNIHQLPSREEVKKFCEKDEKIVDLVKESENSIKALHIYAKKLLNEGLTEDAWKILLYSENIS